MPVPRRRVVGVGADPREPDQRVGEVELFAAGHLAAGGVRVGRGVAVRHDHVLDRPQRLEPGRLGGGGERHGAVGVLKWPMLA